MPDLEKVIKELESLRDICNAKSNMAIGKGKVAWAGYANAAEDAFALLKEQPEVIRCKDCRYGQYCTDGETTYQCFKWNSNEFGALHEQDWFCADGKRSDGVD